MATGSPWTWADASKKGEVAAARTASLDRCMSAWPVPSWATCSRGITAAGAHGTSDAGRTQPASGLHAVQLGRRLCLRQAGAVSWMGGCVYKQVWRRIGMPTRQPGPVQRPVSRAGEPCGSQRLQGSTCAAAEGRQSALVRQRLLQGLGHGAPGDGACPEHLVPLRGACAPLPVRALWRCLLPGLLDPGRSQVPASPR